MIIQSLAQSLLGNTTCGRHHSGNPHSSVWFQFITRELCDQIWVRGDDFRIDLLTGCEHAGGDHKPERFFDGHAHLDRLFFAHIDCEPGERGRGGWDEDRNDCATSGFIDLSHGVPGQESDGPDPFPWVLYEHDFGECHFFVAEDHVNDLLDMRIDLFESGDLRDESFESRVDGSTDDVPEEDAGEVDQHDRNDEAREVEVPVIVPELAEVLCSDFSSECRIRDFAFADISRNPRLCEFFVGDAEPFGEFFLAQRLGHYPDDGQARGAVDGLGDIAVDKTERLPEQPEGDGGGQENRKALAEETLKIATK